jgi:hypothetical protein
MAAEISADEMDVMLDAYADVMESQGSRTAFDRDDVRLRLQAAFDARGAYVSNLIRNLTGGPRPEAMPAPVAFFPPTDDFEPDGDRYQRQIIALLTEIRDRLPERLP